MVRCVGVDSSALTAALDRRLQRAYASADTAVSAQISYTVDLSTTADWPKAIYYQAVFSCSDWTSVRALVFRILDKATGNPITYEHVQHVLTNVSLLQDSYDLPELDRPRDLAWTMLEARILAAGSDPQTLRDPERVAQAGGMLAASLFLRGRPGGSELAELWKDTFDEHWAALEKTIQWFDEDQDAIRDYDETRSTSRMIGRGR